MKICFFVHSNVDKDLVRNRLNICIGRFIGYEKISFYIGNHGNFDELALSCYLKVKENYNIDIFYFFTSLAHINKLNNKSVLEKINLITFDLDNVFYKNKIYTCNKNIIDLCDIVICYVDCTKANSGAKKAVNYARKKGKKIINLYKVEDNFLYGLNNEQKMDEWNKFLNK